MDLEQKVERTIREEQLLRSGDSLVCAVSGGPDSMALLHVLRRLSVSHNWRLLAAHVNHMFRGAQSDREAKVVEDFADRLGIPFKGTKIDVPAYIEERGGNAQASARELRYRFLIETAEQYGAAAIALAHHADDQAETVLMHLLRGSSLSGLTGMPHKRSEKNVELIRPFLRIYKEQLLEYCSMNGIPFLLDSSNELRKYTRNRIRLDVIPLLLHVNPQLPKAINRLADVLRDEDIYMEKQTRAAADRIVQFSTQSCRVSRKSFIAEPVALQRRMIKLILNYLAEDTFFPDYAKIESIRSAILNESPPSLFLDIGSLLRMVRAYDRVEWIRDAADRHPTRDYVYRIETPEAQLWIAEACALLTCSIVEAVDPMDAPIGNSSSENRCEQWFDADQLTFPLIVRSRNSGDRMEPHGLNGSKKLKDMFIDLKVDPDWRNRVPLITDGSGRIVWIPGICRSRYGLITADTSRLLRMKLSVH